jgi:hypothetical protein
MLLKKMSSPTQFSAAFELDNEEIPPKIIEVLALSA